MLKRIFTMTVGIVVGAMACSDSVSDLGNEFLDDLGFDVTVIDTLSLTFSTVRFDSLVSNDGRLLLGNGKEDFIGFFKTGGFFTVLPADETNTLSNIDASFDSITFFFNTDGFFYYDSVGEFNIKLHETAEELEPEDDGRYYNNQFFEINLDENGDSIVIGNSVISLRANGSESEFRINDDLGLALFRLYEDDQVSLGNDDFIDLVEGFYVEFLSTSPFFLGLDKATSGFRLFYRDLDETDIDDRNRELTFLIDPVNSFHSVSISENESAVNRIEDVEESLSSDSTGNESFIQSATGLGCRIDIPNLRTVLEDNPDFQILSAVLEMEVIQESIQDFTPLPNPVTLQVVNERNGFGATLQTQAFASIDAEFNRENLYLADITSFINTELQNSGRDDNGILLIPFTGFSNTVNRVMIGDATKGSRLILNILVNNTQ